MSTLAIEPLFKSVRALRSLTDMPDVQRIIADAEKRLAGTGRLLVRYSGTEMLARVMVEGEDGVQIKTLAQEIGAAIQKYAGAL